MRDQNYSMAKRKSDALSQPAVNENIAAPPAQNSNSARKKSKKTPSESSASSLIDTANSLDPESFAKRYHGLQYREYGSGSGRSLVSLKFADELTPGECDECLNLIASTSRKDYESSNWGWHPKRKKREMKEKEMRYLLVRRPLPGEASQRADDTEFEGFLSFMLTHDSTPAVPVLYIYEIHLTEAARGKGLGRFLMASAESFARSVGVDKVVLTCFLCNVVARNLYLRLGFGTDVCSPGDRKTRNKVVKVDYVIMSKDLKRNEITTNAHEVMEDEDMDVSVSPEANEIPSLDNSPEILRAWTKTIKETELLSLGLEAADSARQQLSEGNKEQATRHMTILQALYQTLQTQWEATRDLDELLREQTYHLKCQIFDIERLAETLKPTPNLKREPSSTETIPDDENFDMEKATEQVYSAFYTLMRKAEEVDNRLDDVADREQELELLENDLDEREEELDSWENDLYEREKALAEREERLSRSKQRFKRQKDRYGVSGESEVFRQDADDEGEMPQALSREGEQVRALPWRQESPARDKVNLWLQNSSGEQSFLAATTPEE
ncbi:acyl- N-acyltransferase [Lecanosticta acicola]|uniref:N-alpha-acetyltransferase 40 n=1 Tax=Lecanosticta acicola TaxID=111012 RepID=A0AAI8Z5C6_9PEZI|nr:acyl- N-acyltransferase [Lecanosticta acicola]